MSSELLVGIAAVVLSLLFSYVPGLKDWFEKLESTPKRLIMLGLLAVVAGGSFGLACIQSPIAPGVTCDQVGAWGLLRVFGLAVIANQSTYAISPKEKAKAKAKAKPPVPEPDGDPVQ